MKAHSLIRAAKNNADDAPAVIFIHGLGGSPSSTWSRMFQCFSSDEAFNDYALDCYQFPTRLVRLPFTPPLPGLREIADGLKTFIDECYPGRKSISLVAHSLGGLVARQYVVSELRAGRPLPISRLALVAVPSTGSTLANVGRHVSLRHRQLKDLSRDDSSLTELNINWEQLKVEQQVDVRYVLGGCDRTVPHDSALPFVGRENKSMLIDADHRSIICPFGTDDIRYLTIKRFLLSDADVNDGQVQIQSLPLFPQNGSTNSNRISIQRPDPLFDIYLPKDDPYYIERNLDKILTQTLGASHVWIVGDSGVGKTASLRRAIYQNGWHLNQITLGAYVTTNPTQVLRALCLELANIAGRTENIPPDISIAEQFLLLKTILRIFPSDLVIANVIEEIPLDLDALAQFGDIVAKFVASLAGEADLYGRIRIAISSINDVRDSSTPMASKSHEHLQVIPADAWAEHDIEKLATLLATVIKPDLPLASQRDIAVASKGSPRFVKQLFRHWRNGTSAEATLEELIAKVSSEQVR